MNKDYYINQQRKHSEQRIAKQNAESADLKAKVGRPKGREDELGD